MYFFIFVTLCLFGHVEAKCLANTPPQETTSSSVKVCSETYTPECGNLTSLFVTGVDTFEQDGCPVFRCPAESLPVIIASFENTELPQPSDANPSLNNTMWIYGPRSAGQVEDTLVSQFGIKCDGDKWKVTKYPMGIYYLSTEKDILFGLGGKYDGMKTEVTQMACNTYN